jgi:hypothetical protein
LVDLLVRSSAATKAALKVFERVGLLDALMAEPMAASLAAVKAEQRGALLAVRCFENVQVKKTAPVNRQKATGTLVGTKAVLKAEKRVDS